jgi:molybdate transport system permease protein
VLDFSAEEIAAVQLSLRVAFWAMLGSLPFGLVAAVVLGATITFVSNIPGETRTIASAIFTLTQTPGGDTAALRLTFVSIALSLVALLAADMLAQRLARRLSGD